MLTRIWNIRSKINQGIIENTPEVISEAINELHSLIGNEEMEVTNIFLNFNSISKNSETADEKLKNLDALIANANAIEQRYVLGNYCSTDFIKTPKCVAASIWTVTAIVDDVLSKVDLPQYKNKKGKLLAKLVNAQNIISHCVREAANKELYTNEERTFLIYYRDYLYHIKETKFAGVSVDLDSKSYRSIY